MGVDRGHKIRIDPEQLGGSQSKTINVKWSQSFSDRQESYYVCQFEDLSDSNAKGVIFVQANKAGELKGRASGTNEYNVDGAFQYGQRKDGTSRWLVYHNRDNKPYQHRFVENTLTGLGNGATNLLSSMGIPQGTSVGDIAKNFIGDYLKSY